MGLLKNETFVCLDCETTGLEIEKDKIIEVAVVLFKDNEILDTFETLIDPEVEIPQESTNIHHITNDMVIGKPKIHEVLPHVIQMIGKHIIVGHGIPFDISFLEKASKIHCIPNTFSGHPHFDTLRLARLYGESPINSLEKLREHFNIAEEGAHRAMSDVVVNIEVFKYLTKNFKTTEQIVEKLKKPISLKTMPLGKHKGRFFSEIPVEYLQWALRKDFDMDLMFSIQSELKKRKKVSSFTQNSNPFSGL